jgi:hypothetical protein
MTKKIIGADITVEDLLDNNNIKTFYASVGKFIEDKEEDEFGIVDYKIFYYFDNLKQLKSNLNKEFADGYKLLNYDLVKFS